MIHLDDDHTFELASAARRSRSRRKQGNRRSSVNHRDLASLHSALPQAVGRSPTQVRGDHYERWAARLLAESGCEILGQQLRCRFGEIDLAVRDGCTLVFVEVRSRQNMRYGGAVGSLGHIKQKRLILAARWWLQALARKHFNAREPPCRFDLIAFESDTLVWIRDAFCAT